MSEHLATFIDVLRKGSFSSAARLRAMTPSAIVRQVDALEASLGVRLLVRSTRALTPTDAGEVMLERGRRILDDLADLENDVATLDGGVAGTLRVACFPTFGKRYVVPVLAELLIRHADLRVELSFEERPAQPVMQRYDAVIRIGALDDSGLIGTQLAMQRRLLVASPAYLEKAPLLARTADLADHSLLDELNRSGSLGWADLLGERVHGHAGPRWRSDDYEALRLATLTGAGVALLPDWVVGPDVRTGELVRLQPDDEAGRPWRDDGVPITLLRAVRQTPPKLQALVNLLRETIGSPPVWDA